MTAMGQLLVSLLSLSGISPAPEARGDLFQRSPRSGRVQAPINRAT